MCVHSARRALARSCTDVRRGGPGAVGVPVNHNVVALCGEHCGKPFLLGVCFCHAETGLCCLHAVKGNCNATANNTKRFSTIVCNNLGEVPHMGMMSGVQKKKTLAIYCMWKDFWLDFTFLCECAEQALCILMNTYFTQTFANNIFIDY